MTRLLVTIALGARITHNYPFSPSNSTLAGTVLPLGETVITWTVTDSCGLTNSCTSTIVVEDNEVPQILNCPDNPFVIQTTPGQCDAIANFAPLVAHDNCTPSHILTWEYSIDGGANWNPGQAYGDVFPLGTTSVWHRTTDQAGNTSAICMFDIVVEDNEDPNAICSPVTTVVDDGCEAVVTAEQIAGSSTDNCDDDLEILISRDMNPANLAPSITFTMADLPNSPHHRLGKSL